MIRDLTWCWSGTAPCPPTPCASVLAEFGFGLVLGPKAETRLLLRDYSERLSDR